MTWSAFASGVFVGVAVTGVLFALEGLFGDHTSDAVFVLACILILTSFALEPSRTSSNISTPSWYYAGLFIGCVITYPLRSDVRTTFQTDDGTPGVVAVWRRVR